MDTIEKTQPALRYLEPFALMRNVRGKFEDVGHQSGEAFQVPWAARGVAFGDLNDDGFPDVAVNSNNQRAVLLLNSGGNSNHWLLVDTIGKASNKDGIGAILRLVLADGTEQHAIVSTAGSYLSASDKRVHFGLGPHKSAKLLEVSWPSGTVQRLHDIAADRLLTVRETNGPVTAK